MDLLEVTSTAFVLLKAEWPVEKSRQLAEQLEPTHAIVRRNDSQGSQVYYYLYTARQALDFLTHYRDVSTYEAFNLHEYAATPVLEEHTSVDSAPERCVVVDADGRLTGFFDASVAAPPARPAPGPAPARNRPAGGRPAGGPRRGRKLFSESPAGGGGTRRGAPRPEAAPLTGSGEPASTESTEPVPRSIVAEFPEKVALGETTSLLVSLSANPVTGADIPVELPVGATIDIVVQPKRGFILEGRGEGSLSVSSEEETLPLQFKVKAIELGPGQLRVTAFRKGQALGAITLVPTIVEDVPDIDAQPLSHKESLAPSIVRLPDLSLFIQERKDINGETVLDMRLTALNDSLGLFLKPFTVRLRVDPFQYFQKFFSDIEALSIDNDRQKAIAKEKLNPLRN